MDKPAIKKFAIWARNKLIADTKYRAGLVGVTETAVAEPLPQSNETVQFFDVGLPQPYRIEGDAVTQRQRFVAELNKETAKQGSYTAAYQTVVDKVAYTWFNRLIAVRYMEVNDLLPSRTRVLSSADGRAEPQIVTSPFDAVLDYTPAEQQQIVTLKNDNKLDEAFRLLFLKQCAALGDCLPRLFEQVDDYMPLLLALSFTDKDGVVCHLVNDIPESDWQDAVQIVGWLYQYYNTEPKEQVFANLKKNIKISAENIPAATQLFTPDWIVRYMVENSLGRLWSEGHPDFDKSNWKYYLDEAPQEPQVAQQLAELRKGYAVLTPEDIKCIDPCMGSGHILAYLFDVLMQIYRSAGYTDRDAAASIVEHNLYGLDIDDRAAQMSGERDAAVVKPDLCAQCAHALEMLVDGTLSDGASARKRNARFAQPRQQRTQHKHGRAHLADILFILRFFQCPCVQNERVRFLLDAASAGGHQGAECFDIRQVRRAFDAHVIPCQKCAAHDGQHGVLGCADGYFSPQRRAFAYRILRHENPSVFSALRRRTRLMADYAGAGRCVRAAAR